MSNKYFKVYYDTAKDYKLSSNELLILSIIHSYTENEKEYFGKQEDIANAINLTRQTVNECLKRLMDKGLIAKKKNGRQTLYVSKIPTLQVSKKPTSDVKKADSQVSKIPTLDVKKADTPCYKQSHKKRDKQSNRNGKPSFDIEEYNDYVENLDLKYKKSD